MGNISSKVKNKKFFESVKNTVYNRTTKIDLIYNHNRILQLEKVNGCVRVIQYVCRFKGYLLHFNILYLIVIQELYRNYRI
jgi:hypothetical protein